MSKMAAMALDALSTRSRRCQPQRMLHFFLVRIFVAVVTFNARAAPIRKVGQHGERDN